MDGAVKFTDSCVLPVVTDETVGADAYGLTMDCAVVTPALAFMPDTVVTRNLTLLPGVREGTDALVVVDTPSSTQRQVAPLSVEYSTR